MALIGNVLKPLTKDVLIPLGLEQQHQQQKQLFIKMFGSGHRAKVSDCTRSSDLASRTTLLIPNEEIIDIMRIGKPLEESGLLLLAKQLKMKQKNKKKDFSECH